MEKKEALLKATDNTICFGVSVFEYLHDTLKRRELAQINNDAQLFLHEVALLSDWEGANADQELVKLLERAAPKTIDAILSGFRSLVDTTSVNAKNLITKLMADYTWNGRDFDAFFRKVGRMLIEAGDDEVKELRVLLSALGAFLADNDSVQKNDASVTIHTTGSDESPWAGLSIHGTGGNAAIKIKGSFHLAIALLKAHRFPNAAPKDVSQIDFRGDKGTGTIERLVALFAYS